MARRLDLAAGIAGGALLAISLGVWWGADWLETAADRNLLTTLASWQRTIGAMLSASGLLASSAEAFRKRRPRLLLRVLASVGAFVAIVVPLGLYVLVQLVAGAMQVAAYVLLLVASALLFAAWLGAARPLRRPRATRG